LNKHQFIEKYFAPYLEQSRRRNPFLADDQFAAVPPSSQELEVLLTYLSKKGVDFIIGDTLAAIKHLKVTRQEIHDRVYRPISNIVLLVSPNLPRPPVNWRKIEEDSRKICWVSPSNGCVKFSQIGSIENIEQDPESKKAKCPVVGFRNLFKMKLKSEKERDLLDLMSLARVVGVPENIESRQLDENQVRTLHFVKLWLQTRSKDKGE